MNTFADHESEAAWSASEHDLPRRQPRRAFLNRGSAALIALITAAAGFYTGARIEKSDVHSSTSGSGSGSGELSAIASRFGASGGGGSSSSGLPAGLSGLAGLGGGSTGTLGSVNGRTLYLKSGSGNTTKVLLSGSTRVSKTENVSHTRLHPGDSVTVQGMKKSNGTIVATSVTDTGATSSASSSSSGGVGSLFGSGG